MVAAVFRTIFAQPDPDTVAATWDQVRDQLAARFPKIGALMDAGRAEVLAFTAFPKAHWAKVWSTDESVNRSRRFGVVGVASRRRGGCRRFRRVGGRRARVGGRL
jgi:putative transposase